MFFDENRIDPTVGEWFWLCNAWETALRQSRMNIDVVQRSISVDRQLQTIQMHKL